MKNFFKNNPEATEVYTTTDGNMFFTRNAAENHAKTLEDRKVTREVNPRTKEVAVVDADDPNAAALGTIQTGVDENGNPELKQIVAATDEKGNAQMHVVAVNDANSAEAKAANDAAVQEAIAETAQNSAVAQATQVAEKVAEVIAENATPPAQTPAKAEKAANQRAAKATTTKNTK